MVGIIFVLLIAVVVGSVAEIVNPGCMPGGIFGSIGTGIVGALLGGWLLVLIIGRNYFGPLVGGIAVIPAMAGSILAVWLVDKVVGPSRWSSS